MSALGTVIGDGHVMAFNPPQTPVRCPFDPML